MIQAAQNTQENDIMDEQNPYFVHLENFDGPMDLLLHLIKSDEVEIWEISISRITAQYLQYLEMMEAMNVEIAGEFLLMAATLMRVKSQRLLPRPPTAGDLDDELITEEDLINRLLTYKIYKEAAASLKKREEDAGPRFSRGFQPHLPDDYRYPLKEVSLYTLIKSYQEIELRDHDAPTAHEVLLEDIRLEDQVAHVLTRLGEGKGKLHFSALLSEERTRLEIVVTFLAILELAREQVLRVIQDQAFEDIWVETRDCDGAVAS